MGESFLRELCCNFIGDILDWEFPGSVLSGDVIVFSLLSMGVYAILVMRLRFFTFVNALGAF